VKIAALYACVFSAKQQLNENIASQIAAVEKYTIIISARNTSINKMMMATVTTVR